MDYNVGTLVLDGNWRITRRIGSGTSGVVYEIKSTEIQSGNAYALKVIRIPQSEDDRQGILNEGMEEASLTDYFDSIRKEITREISVMMDLDGHPNIVSLKHYRAIPHEEGPGWDILIQLELLTTLDKHFSDHMIDEEQIIKVGMDIAKALAYMDENEVVHRDVKPDNIFIDRFGNFKLGDFGTARILERTVGMSKKGTELYMAPEVYRGEKYDRRVDVYSLGIVLYKLANRNRLPFYPPVPKPITWTDREKAVQDRMDGKPLPPPVNARDELAEVILRACAYDREERYATAMELYEALDNVRAGRRTDPVLEGLKKKKVDQAIQRWEETLQGPRQRADELEKRAAGLEAKKKYRGMKAALEEAERLYMQMDDATGKALGELEGLGLTGSNARIDRLRRQRQELRTKGEAARQRIVGAPAPRLGRVLVALVIVALAAALVAQIALYRADPGVDIVVRDGAVIEAGEN